MLGVLVLAAAAGGCRGDHAMPSVATDASTEAASAPADAVDPAGVATGPASPAVTIALDRVGAARVGDRFDPGNWLQEWTLEGAHPEVECAHWRGGVLPDGVSMMVMDGRIERFGIRNDAGPEMDVRTPFDLHLGLSRSEILSRMPAGTEATPHHHSAPEGEYLTWQDPATGHGLRVELMPDHVDGIVWGAADAVTLVEGCS